MAKHPSAVFLAWGRLADFMRDDIAWQPHPTTGERPSVIVGDFSQMPEAETIWLPGRIDDPAEQDFLSFGSASSKDEMFALGVMVSTTVPGVSGRDAMDRLKVLVGQLEVGLRDATTGKPDGLTWTSLEPQCIGWGVSSVAPHVWPSGEGWAGFCQVSVAFQFRL